MIEIQKEPEELIHHEQFKNTPFTLTTINNQKLLRLGKYIIIPQLNTEKEIEEYIQLNMWNIIANTIAAMIDINNQTNNQ